MKSMLGGLGAAVRNLTPIPYVGKRGAGQTPALPFTGKMGMTAQLEAYGSVGILFAIVSRTATAVAQANWRLYRKSASGDPEDRTEVTGHVALDLWNRPNPWMPRQEFVETFQQHIELTGETEWVIGRNKTFSTMPLELWPVRPDRIEPVPHPTEYLTGWVYKGPDGEKVPLDADEVLQVRMPNPLDPYRGLGPVQALLTDLDSERYSAEWNRNFFINGAEPGGLIEVPDQLSDSEFDTLRARWNAQHRGVANAHRVAILEHGTWKDRRFSMRDLQFVELRKASVELVRQSFGFPKPMLGSTDDVNRANAEAAEVMFARWLVVPRLERIKGVLNNDLLALFGAEERYEFDFDNPVPENAEQTIADRDSRVRTVVALIDAGFDPQQVLEAYDMPELAHLGAAGGPGDPQALAEIVQKLYLGTPDKLVISTDEARDMLRAAGAQLTDATPEAPAPPAALPPGPDAHAQHRHVLGRPRHDGPRAEDQDDQLQAVQGDWEAALAAVMAQWGAVVGQWRVDLAAQISAAVEDDDTAALANLTLDTADGEQLLQSAMADMAAVAAGRMAAEAASQGVNVDPGNANLDSLNGYATATVALLAGSLAAAAGREAIRVRGPGTTGAEVAGLVSEFLASLSDRPLQDMLGGALSNAQNSGRIATLRLAPEAAYYANETLDSNTCRYCQEVDGRWLGNDLDEVERSYPNGGYVACAGRERCRGTVTAVWRPEQVGDS